MGLDYSAGFGIGYKVSISNGGSLEGECAETTMDRILKGSGLEYFETGSIAYGDSELFVTLKDGDLDYDNISGQLKLLKAFLDQTPLKIESKGGIVGGLLVY